MKKEQNHHLDIVLFDLGSTLIYFDHDWEDIIKHMVAALAEYFHQAGVVPDQQAFQAFFGERFSDHLAARENDTTEYPTYNVVKDLLTKWGHPDVDEELLYRGVAALYSVSEVHWQVEADARSTLDTLKDQGYRLGIVSNAGDDRNVQRLIDKAQIRDCFEFIISSAACGIRKPNAKIFELALDHFGVLPQKAAMVGDTLGADILGANQLGIRSIWITRRVESPSNGEIRPDHIVSTLAEIPALLSVP